MDELRRMDLQTNSLNGVKEKFLKGIIENFQYIMQNRETIIENSTIRDEKTALRSNFSDKQYKECRDTSLGSNDRWGIVAKKNLFGLEAEVFPELEKKLVLKACSGRFQMQKFPKWIFPKTIDVSDIMTRNEEDKFAEIEEFYNMNNRQVFNTFGVNAQGKSDMNLTAICVVLDSLLKEKYAEIEDVFCYSPGGYQIQIKLADGTKITANASNGYDYLAKRKGITIEKDRKKATVDFDAISEGEERDFLTDINDLEVENVVYRGDAELIAQLQQAMQEQFKSQQIEQKTEQLGAQQIIEFMRQNNLGPNDLALAFAMVLGNNTNMLDAQAHIIEAAKGRGDEPNTKS